MLSWLFRLPEWSRLLSIGVSFIAFAYRGALLTRKIGHIATIWLHNAVLLAMILQSPRQDWGKILQIANHGNLSANLLSGDIPFPGLRPGHSDHA